MKTFALLQIADAVTTLVFLRLGVPEGNGMVARLMADIGIVPALILSKVVITVLAAWLLGARTQNWANIAYGFVVIWNLCAIWLVGTR